MKNEEKIKEIMNKISLALNDATLQQGFEIICKSYSELNKHYDLLNDFTNNQAIKLLKEIEELKAQIEKMKCCGNCFNSLYGNRGENGRCEDCGNKDNWELKK